MLTAALEDRFRIALGDAAVATRDESIAFATAFAQLVVRVLPDEADAQSLKAVAGALAARTDLDPDEIDVLLQLALLPEHRSEVTAAEIAAFGARFGRASENALRVAVEEELDLERFAARYGTAESLLLLDSLFAVCAVDGEIDASEIDRLEAAATRLQVDPMLVGLLFRKHDARHAKGDMTFALRGRDEVVVGRSAAADVRLPDPQVADRHARLVRTPGGWRVVDLGSGRPTLVRGDAVSTAPLQPGDELRVGPYRLVLHADGDELTAFGSQATSSLSLRGVSRQLTTRDGPLTLLDDVEFTVFTGEVVALVGPSGAGKTTLLSAITGIAPPDRGEILFDDGDFHAMLASDRSLVGIVPQEDDVHGELTVREALWYAARLRFRADVEVDAIDEAVDRVTGELGLDRIREQRIGTALQRGISGGQRKRVNLGQELLTRTTRVLFLDEPTSGLDPRTAQEIVSQVRQLADDGRIVFLVTHDVSPSVLALVDHLVVLAPGGRLAWFGPPREACRWFGVDSVDQIFAMLPEDTPEGWRDRYRASPAWRKYVRTREHLLGLEPSRPRQAPAVVHRRSLVRQWRTLTSRYFRVKRRDWVGTGVLLAQAPLLATAFAIVFPAADASTVFVLVLSALWFGASVSVRELIAERPIWRREARVGLRLVPYMASKVVVLSSIVTVQCLLLTGILFVALDMGAFGFDPLALSGVITATGLVGMSLGLLVSASFSSSEAAVGTLPVVLIPQIAFSGLLVKIKEMSVVAGAISYLMVTRFGFEAALKTGERLHLPARAGNTPRTEPVASRLFEIGFKTTTDPDDLGMPMATLLGVLAVFFVAFLTAATWLTGRARKGT
ncbi:MAG: ATP-binding cassette domain-containing protein [Alphaproteobacteria bacterium]|nr:ATP-binding cassette domain-containing protein [Alphaproteobacteria bacterium]